MATLVNFTLKGFTTEGHEAALDFTASGNDVRAELIDAANQMWAAGVYPERQQWTQRHEYEVCDTVVLRMHESADGRMTPLVIMYPQAPYLNRKFLHEYLDRPEQRADFEALIGMKLSDLPVYQGGIYPERGAKPSDAKFFVKVRPFGVLKRVPEQGDSDETREKHRLVRFIPVVSGDAPQPTSDASSARADLGGGSQPRIMGRSEQSPPTPPKSKLAEHFDDAPGANPYGGKPATQPELAGVEGKRDEAEIGQLCRDFYAWASKNYPKFTHDNLHVILEVDSAKDYFVTHSLGDAKTEVMNFAKGLQKASGQ